MFSFFYKESNKSRLDKCLLQETFNADYAALKSKERSMAKAAEGRGKGTIVWRKHFVLHALVEELDQHIVHFNAFDDAYNTGNDKKDLIALMMAMSKTINHLRSDYGGTLTTHRSHYKQKAKECLDTGLAACGVGNMFFGPWGILAGLGILLFGAPLASRSISKVTGLNDTSTESVKIINKLLLTIDRIGLNLGLEENWSNVSDFIISEDHYPDQLNCPITFKLMRDPVFCSLDGRTYEREAITRWLNEHLSSPFNRRELEEGQSAEDVLQENRALKDMIDDYVVTQPAMADQKFS